MDNGQDAKSSVFTVSGEDDADLFLSPALRFFIWKTYAEEIYRKRTSRALRNATDQHKGKANSPAVATLAKDGGPKSLNTPPVTPSKESYVSSNVGIIEG